MAVSRTNSSVEEPPLYTVLSLGVLRNKECALPSPLLPHCAHRRPLLCSYSDGSLANTVKQGTVKCLASVPMNVTDCKFHWLCQRLLVSYLTLAGSGSFCRGPHKPSLMSRLTLWTVDLHWTPVGASSRKRWFWATGRKLHDTAEK